MSDRLYFTTDHDGVFVEDMAAVYGLRRLPGENDAALRERVQRVMRATRHGTRQEICSAVVSVGGVTRCSLEEIMTEHGGVLELLVHVEHSCRGVWLDELRAEVDQTLHSTVAAGVNYTVTYEREEPEHPIGLADARDLYDLDNW